MKIIACSTQPAAPRTTAGVGMPFGGYACASELQEGPAAQALAADSCDATEGLAESSRHISARARWKEQIRKRLGLFLGGRESSAQLAAATRWGTRSSAANGGSAWGEARARIPGWK